MTEKEPMWTDELDEREGSVTMTPFPVRGERPTGVHGVRVVTKRGVVYEGVTDFPTYGRSSQSPVIVNGVRFSSTSHTISLLDPTQVVVRNPPPITLTDEEVRDLIADITAGRSTVLGYAPSASLSDIVSAAIGFDPTIGVPERAFGGLTDDGYINQFVKVAPLRKSLERLAEAGVIRKAVSRRGDPADDSPYVSILGRVGYLTMDAYEDAVARVKAARNDAAIAKLRAEAARIVADRHQDEVETELNRLLEEKGITR